MLQVITYVGDRSELSFTQIGSVSYYLLNTPNSKFILIQVQHKINFNFLLGLVLPDNLDKEGARGSLHG